MHQHHTYVMLPYNLPALLNPAEAAIVRETFAPGVRVRQRRGRWLGTMIERPADADPGVDLSALWVMPDTEQPEGVYPMPPRPASYADSVLADDFDVLRGQSVT